MLSWLNETFPQGDCLAAADRAGRPYTPQQSAVDVEWSPRVQIVPLQSFRPSHDPITSIAFEVAR